jgi:hypothetical protein
VQTIHGDEESVEWASVRGCDSRALVAAVNEENEVISILDAVTDELSETQLAPVNGDLECVAASQASGRTLVAIGHRDGMVRVREAKSGKLIGRWQAPSKLDQVVIDAAARRVMAQCDDWAFRVWSFAGDDASMDHDDGRTAARREEKVVARPRHVALRTVVGLSPDGQTAASCDQSRRGNVIVWNATTGNSIRQFETEWPSDWEPCAVTASNNAEWTLALGTIEYGGRRAHLRLWDSAGQLLYSSDKFKAGQLLHSSDKFKINHDLDRDAYSLSFTPDGHGCVLLIENRRKGIREMHEWTISDIGFVEVERGTTTKDLHPPCIEPGGTKELLLRGGSSQLAVCRAARGEEEHCTCTAIAYFDGSLNDYCAWSSPPIPGGPSPSAHNHSTVMVGLWDGNVNFMEFRV